jgi:hypothetical protein
MTDTKHVCVWVYNALDRLWEAGCGRNWDHLSPIERRYRYCPYCGKKLEVRDEQ